MTPTYEDVLRFSMRSINVRSDRPKFLGKTVVAIPLRYLIQVIQMKGLCGVRNMFRDTKLLINIPELSKYNVIGILGPYWISVKGIEIKEST